jgi:cell fate regulator YaaT (PSP1 superfamily)
MADQEILTYIEFAHAKLGQIRKIKWDPEIGEPVHGVKFIFRDEYGEDWGVVLGPTEPPEIEPPQPEAEVADVEEGDEIAAPSKSLVDGIAIRYLTTEDETVLEDLAKDEKEFLEICRKRVEHHGLQMKMLATDIRFDRRKVTFHFAAEGRVDFRMLVRDLAGIFRCRIELHQIGARDEAKLYVASGPCGRELCCRTWLTQFQTIGIKMARAQNLPLNPGKISGNCGRLLCCLAYEFENYLELAETLPRIGEHKLFDGVPYEVVYVSPLSQTVMIQGLSEDERHKRIKITGEEYSAGKLPAKKTS